MHHRKILFLLINLVGGGAVLGSYVYGFITLTDTTALWGGVPEAMRPVYGVNMWLAAAGYLVAFTWLLLKADPERSLPNGTPLFERLNWLYTVILFGSALWLPTTAALLQAPDPALWLGVRAILAAVGIAALSVLLVLWQQRRVEGGVFYTLALVGLLPFCLQTAVLDALIWPYYFPAP
jgi:hypothetical protein